MTALGVGAGPLFADPDPEIARKFFRGKSRAMTDKRMSVKEAVSTFIADGNYLASGGFGVNRISTATRYVRWV